jgi:dolichol-phosphate mannosyltransferase
MRPRHARGKTSANLSALFAGPSMPTPAAPETSIGRPARAPSAPLLSIVVPTFNERSNVGELVRRLELALAGIEWEVVFVDDDSTDGTTTLLRAAARSNGRVRVLHRIGRRGLATAVVEGIMSVSAPFVAVMDGDLQHDERQLTAMLETLRASDREIVVGSRYMEGGSAGDWLKDRQTISRLATRLARLVLSEPLSDPMSGFFMLRREAFDRAVRRLSGVGYKILLDILISARPPLAVAEVPYEFRNRAEGSSKLDSAVAWEYLVLLLDKTVGRIAPIRFVLFVLVGGAGVVVHMAILAALSRGLELSFIASQTAATVIAMTFNFFANNALTYRDQRLRGPLPILLGLLSFYAVCSVGAVSNVGIAAFLFLRDYAWWLSGLAGILVGAVWNYAASSIFTWRVHR